MVITRKSNILVDWEFRELFLSAMAPRTEPPGRKELGPDNKMSSFLRSTRSKSCRVPLTIVPSDEVVDVERRNVEITHVHTDTQTTRVYRYV